MERAFKDCIVIDTEDYHRTQGIAYSRRSKSGPACGRVETYQLIVTISMIRGFMYCSAIQA